MSTSDKNGHVYRPDHIWAKGGYIVSHNRVLMRKLLTLSITINVISIERISKILENSTDISQ